MFLGYYKSRIKDFVKQTLGLFLLRYRGVNIAKGCRIHKNCDIKKGVYISEHSILHKSVKLATGVRLGSYVVLSRVNVGENTAIESGVKCTGYGDGKIVIGKESYIGINNVLDWSDNITIGDFVHIAGPSTGLWTHSSAKQCHYGKPLQYKEKDLRPTGPITIEDYVYIGGNCTIYPGVTIGHHSIIAPNSAVTKDVPSFSLVGGVPAKLIKNVNA